MTRLYFWDTDSQQDFYQPGGTLTPEGSELLVPVLERLSAFAHRRSIRVIATACAHAHGDRELSDHPDFTETFPPHCLDGTPGASRLSAAALRNPLVIPADRSAEPLAHSAATHDGDLLFTKHRFDPFTNPHLVPVLHTLAPEVLVLYGGPLDLGLRHVIEGLARHFPHTRLYLVADATRAIRPETGEHLLKEWAEEGVRLVQSEEILEAGILDRYLDG